MIQRSLCIVSLVFVAAACATPAPEGIAADPNTAASPPPAPTKLHWTRFPILGGPPCKVCDPGVTKIDCPANAESEGACSTEGARCVLRCDPASCPVTVTCRRAIDG